MNPWKAIVLRTLFRRKIRKDANRCDPQVVKLAISMPDSFNCDYIFGEIL